MRPEITVFIRPGMGFCPEYCSTSFHAFQTTVIIELCTWFSTATFVGLFETPSESILLAGMSEFVSSVDSGICQLCL